VWRQADKYGVPRVAFVNKMDRIGADFPRAVEMIRERFGANAIPLQLPIGAEESFEGVIDLIRNKALYWEDDSLGAKFRADEVPATLRETANEAREQLVEAAAEFDDDLMARYLEGAEVSDESVVGALRRGTLALEVVPVLCGSSFKNKGVQPLLDAVVDYLPSPVDVPPVEGTRPKDGATVSRNADDNEPFSALVFKLVSDKHAGYLAYLRVYSGTAKSGDTFLNGGTGQKQRVGRFLRMHANKRQDVEGAYAGDIVAAVGLKGVATGDTICGVNAPIVLESLEFPAPVISIAIEPKTTADMAKLSGSLERLALEDPSFKVSTDRETGQTIISGMGELHLEIISSRLLREFKVDANVGRPQVAYKEAITRSVTVEGRYVKQTGGSGEFGVVTLEVSPGERGEGFHFENAIRGESIPKDFISAIERSCSESVESGMLAGFPVADVSVKLLGGESHDEDSSERSFSVAAAIAMGDALRKADPVLLEPVMAVEVVTPEEYRGAVQGDLNSRRGQIMGIDMRGGAQVITAEVSLAEMFGYVGAVRSMTQGRASYTMQFSHYDQAPDSVADSIVAR
jgi:elongation factor G